MTRDLAIDVVTSDLLEPKPTSAPSLPPQHQPRVNEPAVGSNRPRRRYLTAGLVAGVTSLLVVLAAAVAIRLGGEASTSDATPTRRTPTTADTAAASAELGPAVVQLLGVEPGHSMKDGESITVSAGLVGSDIERTSLLVNGVIVGEANGEGSITYDAKPGDTNIAVRVELATGERIESTPVALSVATTAPPPTASPPTAAPATAPPSTAPRVLTFEEQAEALVQEHATALADGDWALAAALEPDKRDHSIAEWERGYGALEASTTVPVRVSSIGSGRYEIRMGLVAHELQAGGRITIPFCVTWIANISNHTVEQTSIDSRRLSTRDGWTAPEVLRATFEAEC